MVNPALTGRSLTPSRGGGFSRDVSTNVMQRSHPDAVAQSTYTVFGERDRVLGLVTPAGEVFLPTRELILGSQNALNKELPALKSDSKGPIKKALEKATAHLRQSPNDFKVGTSLKQELLNTVPPMFKEAFGPNVNFHPGLGQIAFVDVKAGSIDLSALTNQATSSSKDIYEAVRPSVEKGLTLLKNHVNQLDIVNDQREIKKRIAEVLKNSKPFKDFHFTRGHTEQAHIVSESVGQFTEVRTTDPQTTCDLSTCLLLMDSVHVKFDSTGEVPVNSNLYNTIKHMLTVLNDVVNLGFKEVEKEPFEGLELPKPSPADRTNPVAKTLYGPMYQLYLVCQTTRYTAHYLEHIDMTANYYRNKRIPLSISAAFFYLEQNIGAVEKIRDIHSTEKARLLNSGLGAINTAPESEKRGAGRPLTVDSMLKKPLPDDKGNRFNPEDPRTTIELDFLLKEIVNKVKVEVEVFEPLMGKICYHLSNHVLQNNEAPWASYTEKFQVGHTIPASLAFRSSQLDNYATLINKYVVKMHTQIHETYNLLDNSLSLLMPAAPELVREKHEYILKELGTLQGRVHQSPKHFVDLYKKGYLDILGGRKQRPGPITIE